MQLLITLLNLRIEIFSTFAMASFNFAEMTELLFIELSKNRKTIFTSFRDILM